jgi:hypothetical protein
LEFNYFLIRGKDPGEFSKKFFGLHNYLFLAPKFLGVLD